MEGSHYLMSLPIQLIVLITFFVSAKSNIPSSDPGRKYYHLYVMGFVLLVKTAFTAVDAAWPDDDSLLTTSYNVHRDLDQRAGFVVARRCQRVGELILTASIYATWYKHTVDWSAWSWSFATAVAAAWAFMASFLYSSPPLRFDSNQSLTKTRFAGDMLLWSAFVGITIGTIFAQRALKPGQAAPLTSSETKQFSFFRWLRAALLILGLVVPANWLQHLKHTYSSDALLLHDLQSDSSLFLLPTIGVTMWTAAYLTLLSTPTLSKLSGTNWAWSLLLLATHLLGSQPWSNLFDQVIFLIYPIAAISGVVQASMSTNTRSSPAADVKVDVDYSTK